MTHPLSQPPRDHEHEASHHHHPHQHEEEGCCCSESGWDLGALIGPLWVIGWLFTIGFAHLGLPKLLWALVVWPYYLGVALRAVPPM